MHRETIRFHITFILDEGAPLVHHAKKEHSSANLQQRIVARNHSSLFVWFSSKTGMNRRGSLMVYRADGGIVTTWYASLAFGDNWRVARTEGIAQQELVRMFKP